MSSNISWGGADSAVVTGSQLPNKPKNLALGYDRPMSIFEFVFYRMFTQKPLITIYVWTQRIVKKFLDFENESFQRQYIVDNSMIMRPDLLTMEINNSMDFTELLKTNYISNLLFIYFSYSYSIFFNLCVFPHLSNNYLCLGDIPFRFFFTRSTPTHNYHLFLGQCSVVHFAFFFT